jgi:hypothetical protein
MNPRLQIPRHVLIRILTSVSCALLLVQCETSAGAQNASRAVGAGLGAALGGVIGHQSGRGREGAALGAMIGYGVVHIRLPLNLLRPKSSNSRRR